MRSGHPTKGGSPACGLGKGCSNSSLCNTNMLQKVTQDLRFGKILWNDLRNKKGTWDLEFGV